MNMDQIAGNLEQVHGHLTEKWGKLTGDDFTAAKGSLKVLAGRIHEHYGIAREQAENEISEIVARFHAEQRAGQANVPFKVPEVATEGAPVDTKTLKIGM
jgi:uncharacterized protein YjbJ (UPF0337 family)